MKNMFPQNQQLKGHRKNEKLATSPGLGISHEVPGSTIKQKQSYQVRDGQLDCQGVLNMIEDYLEF